MMYAVLIVAAVALGLAAFALYVAVVARGRAIDADRRVARHQQEHRSGLEDIGLRRHRADPGDPTSQLAAQRPRVPSGATAAPATALAAATPPATGPYAKLRESRDEQDRRIDTGDLPTTAAHAAPRRPGNTPNFGEPPPRRTRPELPPPGAIDRDR